MIARMVCRLIGHGWEICEATKHPTRTYWHCGRCGGYRRTEW